MGHTGGDIGRTRGWRSATGTGHSVAMSPRLAADVPRRTGPRRCDARPWIAQRIGADSSDATYRSVLRTHVYPVIGDRQIRMIRWEQIKEIIATMSRKGLSPSRIAVARLVINAVFNEAVRDKKVAESPCTDVPVPDIVHAADFVFPRTTSWTRWRPGCRRTGPRRSG